MNPNLPHERKGSGYLCHLPLLAQEFQQGNSSMGCWCCNTTMPALLLTFHVLIFFMCKVGIVVTILLTEWLKVERIKLRRCQKGPILGNSQQKRNTKTEITECSFVNYFQSIYFVFSLNRIVKVFFLTTHISQAARSQVLALTQSLEPSQVGGSMWMTLGPLLSGYSFTECGMWLHSLLCFSL